MRVVVPRPFDSSRNRHVDRLRGLSIVVVLLLHFAMYVPARLWPFPGEFFVLTDVWPLLVRNGYYGVTIFFVISGFLVSRNSIARYGALSRINLRDFYVTRAARIMPGLLLVIVVVVLLSKTGYLRFNKPVDGDLDGSVVSLLLFRFDWYALRWPVQPAWSPLWSLSIEGISYALFPLVCRLCLRDRVIILPMLAAVVVSPYMRVDYGHTVLWSGCVDQMAIGCLTAMGTASRAWPRVPARAGPVLRTAGMIMIAVVYLYRFVNENYVLGPTLIALGTAIFLAGSSIAETGPILGPLRARLGRLADGAFWMLEGLGRRSYEIYLFHLTVIVLFRDWLGEHAFYSWSVVFLPAYFVGLLAFGSLLAALFTEPLNRVIRLTLRRRATP